MTKLKNTKKGMAKKALSISLVAAMLATSNVPVWAAEFTDGTDAVVEAPVVEEAVDTFSAEAEAPVVEEEVNDVATYAATEATLKLTNWKDTLKVDGTLKDADGKALTGNITWEVRINGREVVGHTGTYKNTCDVSDLTNDLKKATFVAEDAENLVSLKISQGSFYTELADIKIENVNIDGKGSINLNGATLTYTGEQVAFTDAQIKNFQITGDASTTHGLTSTDFTYKYEGDLINATKDKKVTLIATVNKPGYVGEIKNENVTIGKRPIVADKLEVTLNKDTISYAERTNIPSDMVTVKDIDTGLEFPASTYTVSSTVLSNGNAKVGDSDKLTVKFDLSKDEAVNRNYSANNASNKETDTKVKLTANNLSDFTIKVDSVKRENFNNSTAKAATHFYLGDKEVTNAVKEKITFAAEAVQSDATSGNVVLTGDNVNILGTTTVSVNLTLNELTKDSISLKVDDVVWDKTDVADVTYTGTEIARDIKDVKVGGNVGLTTSDYKIEYVGDLTNAYDVSKKEVEMYIVGIGNYSGKVKLGSFKINPAEIKGADIKVPETVQYDGSLQTADEYMNGKVTAQAVTTVKGEEKKIDVPADAYTLTYTTDKGLVVGSQITTKLESSKIINKNFKITGSSVEASKKTTISNKDLADKDVKVEVVGGPYTYTGKAVVPTLKVTVAGVELALDRDYKVMTTGNSTNAGNASVIVVGLNDYSGSQTVNYVINKANLADVKTEAKVEANKNKFTYTGKQVKPTSAEFKITLNGVDLDSKDFAITYPTSSLTNVDAGEATVTLVPVKKNTNFVGDKLDVKFNILPRELTTAELDGKFYAFDENGNKIDFTNKYIFAYDGTEKTFKDVKFVATKHTFGGMDLVEGKDYEVKYYNNITGPKAYIYVTGIGNYAGNKKFDGSETAYIDRLAQEFAIEGVTVDQRNMTLKDTEYAGGVATTPNLTIKVGEKTLVEGTDYKFINLEDNVDVTPDKKVLKATLKMKAGYELNTDPKRWSGAFSNPTNVADGDTVDVTWKIVKKDLANTKVVAEKEADDLTVTVYNGNVIVPEKEYDVKDNGDGTVTVTAKKDSKNYTGTQKVTIEEMEAEVGKSFIKEVKVVGNKATVVLEGDVDGATGYDFVVSTNGQSSDKNRLVNKNVLATETTFQYLQQGIYYAHCHAWKKVNGKKVFGEYSEAFPFSVTAITPDQPSVTSVKVSKNTVKVTYTKSTNATGYDLVLGKSLKKVNGEMRPVDYGKQVKKVYNGNTVTATFTKVPKGTYYVGLHAYNRTSEDGKKVFSPWSNAKKVVVK